ncbi:MAG: hypothetical protein SCH71_04300 [Desulfobulbaceae bacterium]|nr:hypothetical protein [Desulfobulbaceae bacterium]
MLKERVDLGKKIIFLASAVLLLTPLASFGQAESGFQKGEREFTIVGSGSSDESLDNTSLSASFSIGQFLTDNLEVALRQEGSYIDLEDDDDWAASTRLVLDYNFGRGPLVPMVGLSFGYLYGDRTEEQFIAGPEVGLKYFVNAMTFIYGLVEYQFLFEDVDDVDEVYDDGRFVYGIGLGLTF